MKMKVWSPLLGEATPFTFEAWVPSKKVKSLNEKTGKMGNKYVL